MADSIEDTLDSLVAKLTADLPAKITAINAAVTDGHTLDNPHLIESNGVGELEGYPTILVLPQDPSEPELDQGVTMLVRHRVAVIVFQIDSDTHALGKKILRYQRAVKEVLLSQRDPGTAAAGWQIEWLEDGYGPLFRPVGDRGPEAAYIQGTRSVFRVKQEQRIT
jgi:hypothetical protein